MSLDFWVFFLIFPSIKFHCCQICQILTFKFSSKKKKCKQNFPGCWLVQNRKSKRGPTAATLWGVREAWVSENRRIEGSTVLAQEYCVRWQLMSEDHRYSEVLILSLTECTGFPSTFAQESIRRLWKPGWINGKFCLYVKFFPN